MKSLFPTVARRVRRGFSLVEVIISVGLIGVVASIAIVSIGTNSTSVRAMKLQSDVQKLNQIVSVYLGQGGTLTGLTTPQAVIDQLKTTVSAADQARNVGVMTGRGVDLRLTTQMQSASDAAGTTPRVTWDTVNQKFVYSNAPGPAGVSNFVLDDTLASTVPASQTRTKSNELYNSTNGWVWSAGSYVGSTPVGPADVPLTDSSNNYSPIAGSAGSSTGSSGGTPGVLPAPIVSPTGGTYPLNLYPTQIYINPNGAPDGSSILEYRLNGGSWMVYTGPFSVASGTKVEAKNFSTNSAAYNSSVSDVESFYFLVPSFTGSVAALWYPSTGASGFTSTVNNSNPDSVTEKDGVAASGYLPNSFAFARASSFSNVPPNGSFNIGQLTYYNGTINANNNGTSTGSTGLHLQMNITMSSPSIATTAADVYITLVNTPNTSDAAASADIATLANPVTNYSVVLNGVTYTLNVRYGAIDVSQGFVDTNNTSLHVYEGASGTVPIVASFVSSTP